MKNVKKCSVCKKPSVRVLLAGKYVNTSHQQWRDDKTCPSCKPKVYNKGECKGCGKEYSIHFQGKEYCSSVCLKNHTKD